MKYRVIYTDAFLDDVRAQVSWFRRQGMEPEAIEDWFGRLFDKLDNLDIWPRTFAVSESYSSDAGRPTHKFNFGRYLIFYQVDDDQHRVELVAFFGGEMDWKK